ncbi:hypothetical protein QOZ80_8BG0650240 [Eleusine coracana subsp. coracana]|nr:hypothetical protein QOZ80_8BG0650240 [Eleusine coracana subsp. coracana]
MAEEAKQNDAATIACQAGQAALAARLLKRISAVTADKDQNLVFSPLSIHVALALMARVVDHVLADRSDVGGPSISYACGAWTDKRWPLRPSYVDAIVGTFKGKTCAVDFRGQPLESRRQINAWVAEATRNLITEILDPNDPNPDTVHVIANALYFKGE